MKNKSLCPVGFQRLTEMSLWLPTLLVGLLCQSSTVQAASRIVTWGDLACDVDAGSASGAPVVQVASGSFHGLVLRKDWTVSAWGDNRFGQAEVPDSLKRGMVRAIAAGNVHSLALLWTGRPVP